MGMGVSAADMEGTAGWVGGEVPAKLGWIKGNNPPSTRGFFN